MKFLLSTLLPIAILLLGCEKTLAPQEWETNCAGGVAKRTDFNDRQWWTYDENETLLDSGHTEVRMMAGSWSSCIISLNRATGVVSYPKDYEIDSATGDTLSYFYCDGKGKRYQWFSYMPAGVELISDHYVYNGKDYRISSRWDAGIRDTVVKTVIAYRNGDTGYKETLEAGQRQVYVTYYSAQDSTVVVNKYYYGDGVNLTWYTLYTDPASGSQYYCK